MNVQALRDGCKNVNSRRRNDCPFESWICMNRREGRGENCSICVYSSEIETIHAILLSFNVHGVLAL